MVLETEEVSGPLRPSSQQKRQLFSREDREHRMAADREERRSGREPGRRDSDIFSQGTKD